jgi:methylmalonyl-CoA mutase C-terminal domain/subunit
VPPSGKPFSGGSQIRADPQPLNFEESIRMPTSAALIRVVLAKVGLDGHDRGIKVVARALRDAGMHVIYAGLWQTPEAVVRAVADEDADWLGLSILSGAHLTLVPRVLQLLREAGLQDVRVLIGGIIPEGDTAKLLEMGVARVFGPGTPLTEIVDFLRGHSGASHA